MSTLFRKYLLLSLAVGLALSGLYFFTTEADVVSYPTSARKWNTSPFGGQRQISSPVISSSLPTDTASLGFHLADDPGLLLAHQAWELRFDQPQIALHLMSKALQLSQDSEVISLAEQLLKEGAFVFKASWALDMEGTQALCVDSQKQRIAIGDDMGSITLLDSGGTVISQTSAHQNTVSCLAFSPDGQFLASGSHDNGFALWKIEPDGLSEAARVSYGEDWVRDLVFTPDAQQLLVTGDMYYTLVYDLPSGEIVDTLRGHENYLYAVEIDPTGKLAITGDGQGLVDIWQKKGNSWKKSDNLTFPAKISDFSFENPKRLLVAMDGGAMGVVNLRNPSSPAVEIVKETGTQDLFSIAAVNDGIVAGGSAARLDFIFTQELIGSTNDGVRTSLSEVVQGIAAVDGIVAKVHPWRESDFLLCTNASVSLGKIQEVKVGSVAHLRTGRDLPYLSLTDQLTYNLWAPSDIEKLDESGLAELFATISYHAAGGSPWPHTNLPPLTALYAEEGIKLLKSYQGGSTEGRLALITLVQTAGLNSSLLSAISAKGSSPAQEAFRWIAIGGQESLAPDLRKYAIRRAYALMPSQGWGAILAEGMSMSLSETEKPQATLAYACDANSVSYSPTGDYLYVTTDKNEECQGGYLYPVTNGIAQASQGIFFPHQSGIMWQGSFSSDGQRIVSASTDGTVMIYNLMGGTEQIYANEEGETPFADARILRNGDVITADNLGRILRWKMKAIRPEALLMEHANEARKIAINAKDESVLSVGYDGALRIFAQGKQRIIDINDQGIEDIALNQAGTHALLGLVAGGAALVNLDTEDVIDISDNGNDGIDFQSVAFSKDETILYAGTEGGILKAFSHEGTFLWEKRIHQGPVYDISISPDGKTMATAGGDDLIAFWNLSLLANSSSLWTTEPAQNQSLTTLEWSSLLGLSSRAFPTDVGLAFVQELWLSTTKKESRAQLEEAIAGSLFYQLSGKTIKSKGGLVLYRALPQGINAIGWSSTSQAMIAVGASGQIFLLDDIGGFSLIGNTLKESDLRCATKIGDSWALASLSGQVFLLDEQLRLSETLQPHETTIYDIAASPDGKKIATASADLSLSIIDTESLDWISLSGHENEVNAVAFLPDGSGLLSASDDQTIIIWDMAGNEQRRIEVGANIWSLAISPDGKLIAMGSNEGEIILLDDQGKVLKRWSESPDAIWTLLFSPDGQLLVSANNSGDVTAYLRDGTKKFSFDMGDDSILDAAFSPDGTQLYLAGSAGEVLRFQLSQ